MHRNGRWEMKNGKRSDKKSSSKDCKKGEEKEDLRKKGGLFLNRPRKRRSGEEKNRSSREKILNSRGGRAILQFRRKREETFYKREWAVAMKGARNPEASKKNLRRKKKKKIEEKVRRGGREKVPFPGGKTRRKPVRRRSLGRKRKEGAVKKRDPKQGRTLSEPTATSHCAGEGNQL